MATVRAIHFTAILLLEGAVVFQFAIAAPILRDIDGGDCRFDGARRFLKWMVGSSLIVGVLSGAAWLFVLAGRIAGASAAHALIEGVDWTLLTQTQFGEVWQWRAAASAILALSLAVAWRDTVAPRPSAAIAIVLAIFLAGSLAWAGHGAATPGAFGNVHLAADILHLIAAGLWIGGLPPLALVLAIAARTGGAAGLSAAARVTRHFSSLAAASVLLLLLSGIVNTYALVGRVSALVDTTYGQLLSVKIGLFFVMLGFAAVNRLRLTPRLRSGCGNQSARVIARNSMAELILGVSILVIVGVLGTLPPATRGHHDGTDAANAVPARVAVAPRRQSRSSG
ncbi:MAG: copper homeostasis membrane protein CopD [Pseudolabrys sp.]